MLRNISLSFCADQVKFAVSYKDFDINSNYSIYQETTFELTEEYFKKKRDNYNLQDTCVILQ
jgi:hypothetical protein